MIFIPCKDGISPNEIENRVVELSARWGAHQLARTQSPGVRLLGRVALAECLG
jgi:hypothetical protein